MNTEFGPTYKVFQNREQVAACFQLVTAEAGYETIRIELTTMKDNNAQWDEKWRVDIAMKEQHSVASVLSGFRQCCEFKYHGTKKNNSYSLSRGASGVTLTLHHAGPKRSILLDGNDTFWVAAMVIDVISKNAPKGFPYNQILPLLQRTQFT
jgi:hypothetical protein